MLRITVRTNPEFLTFQLEGRLAGAWVKELEHCLRETQGRGRKSVPRFDLTGVTFIDPVGKAFLAASHAEGARFIAVGCLMKAIVAEITAMPIPACGETGMKTSHQVNREAT
jgi:hypothetical protein